MPIAIAILSIVVLITGYFFVIYFNRSKVIKNYANLLKTQFEQYKIDSQQQISYYRSKTLHNDIHKAIQVMDETCTSYTDEDSANRELTTCLRLLGQNAKYHYSLDDHRILDIVVDDVIIIEGKLDPSQSEIDRLVGQIEDYLQYKVEIIIVVYGNISQESIKRVEGIVNKCSPYVSFIYHKNPHRSRLNGQ
jgi:hypothetical protein